MKRGKDMNAMQPQTEHLSDVEDIKREPKKHHSHYSKQELDPLTTGHTDTKVTLPPHHTRAVTVAMAVKNGTQPVRLIRSDSDWR